MRTLLGAAEPPEYRPPVLASVTTSHTSAVWSWSTSPFQSQTCGGAWPAEPGSITITTYQEIR